MFSKFIMLTVAAIKSRPITAAAITLTGGAACGSLILSYYKKKETNHSNNILDKVKRSISTVTDKTVDYVGGCSKDTSNKIKRGIKIVSDETVDHVSKSSQNHYVYKVGDRIYKEFFSTPKPKP